MNKKLAHTVLAALALALSLAGCATFGIQSAGAPETREGLDYKLLVNAWDKKATDLGVVFSYRVNGGPWQQRPGVYNGSLYEAVVPGSELTAGYLEYYATMKNAKGQAVSSKPLAVKVLTFAEAKSKAEREYLSRLSDATASEFLYDEPATFRLRIAGTQGPVSVQCTVKGGAASTSLDAIKDPSGTYSAALPTPHSASFYAFQWTVAWQDAAFGRIESVFPSSPRSVPVLDRAAVRSRVEGEFRAALKAPGAIAGTYFDPPVVQARLEYGSFARKYSTGPRQVSLLLRGIGYGKQIAMSEVQPGLFSATIPSADLERGPADCSFLYADSFADLGALQAQYPLGQGIPIAYKSLEDFRQDAISDARGALSHVPPADAVEGAPLNLRLDVKDPSLQVLAVGLDGTPPLSFGKGIPFVRNGSSWFASIPGAAVRAGEFRYSITAIVRDPRFGDLAVPLAGKDGFAAVVKSLAQFRKEREDALRKSLSHAVPSEAVQGRPLGLVLQQSVALQNESASLFYRTAESPRYRELRAPFFSGNNTFMLDAQATRTAYIQYYFAVSQGDPILGTVTATLRDSSGGSDNDFLIMPRKDDSQGPGAIEPPASPPKALSYFKGPQADRAALRFFVELDDGLGTYDVSVSVRIQGVDKDFHAYGLERKGKEYSYTLDARALDAGSRVDFSYSIYRKGVLSTTLANPDGTPFSAILK